MAGPPRTSYEQKVLLFLTPIKFARKPKPNQKFKASEFEPLRPGDNMPLYDPYKFDPAAIVVLTRTGEPVRVLNRSCNLRTYYEELKPLTKPGEKELFTLYSLKPESVVFNDFLLQVITIREEERSQISETFDGIYIHFARSSIPIMHARALLLNTPNYPWLHEWLFNWHNAFKGSKLIENNARAYILINGLRYEGYFLDYTLNQNSQEDKVVTVDFTFLITDVSDVLDAIQAQFGRYEKELTLPKLPEGQSNERIPLDFALEFLRNSLVQLRAPGDAELKSRAVALMSIMLILNKTLPLIRERVAEKLGDEAGDIIFTDLIFSDLLGVISQGMFNPQDWYAWLAIAKRTTVDILRLLKALEKQPEQLQDFSKIDAGYSVKQFFKNYVQEEQTITQQIEKSDLDTAIEILNKII